ncbi:MAG: hypothetical protein OXP75_19060 [Rhodospirillales bacterium]|nr:hypothetical protein [Rhodospirillales bacterium]
MIFWTGDWPKDPQEQHKIAEETIPVNNGRVLRVTLGLNLDRTVKPNPAGSFGRCFCLIEGNTRRCEGPYIRDGHTVWVVCGGAS